jgi:hypothetical protein
MAPTVFGRQAIWIFPCRVRRLEHGGKKNSLEINIGFIGLFKFRVLTVLPESDDVGGNQYIYLQKLYPQ